jgi:hypothetical protein
MVLKRLIPFALLAANGEHAPDYCCLTGDQPALNNGPLQYG